MWSPRLRTPPSEAEDSSASEGGEVGVLTEFTLSRVSGCRVGIGSCGAKSTGMDAELAEVAAEDCEATMGRRSCSAHHLIETSNLIECSNLLSRSSLDAWPLIVSFRGCLFPLLVAGQWYFKSYRTKCIGISAFLSILASMPL